MFRVAFLRQSSLALALVLLSLGLLPSLLCSSVLADAASGTYTGSLSLRGNYYWEKSTRVIAPNAAVSLATPSGVRVEGSYLLDAITSASQATGVVDDVAFTEKRNEVQAGLGYEVDLGAQQLDLSARGRFSKEPDYLSRGVGFGSALSLDQRNTVLHLNGYFVHDDVQRQEVEVGDLDVLSLGLAWDQVLNATTTLTVGYDLSYLNGFQANAYRTVKFADGGGAPEKHPEKRVRNAGYFWLSHYLLSTRTTLRAGYRLYRDNWDLLAHALEARMHQELGPYLETRLRYRYFTQGPSYFFRAGGNLRADEYITDDPKMSAFHDHTLGLKLRLSLAFLAFTAIDALHTAVIDWGVEYVFNTNRYGNGVIAQGGLGWSF